MAAQPYEAFKDPFLAGLKDWDPAAWAESFRDAGARYVVLVTKHHDGFCLWPSGVQNPERGQWFTERDIVGELAAAVRAAGLRFGVYYSGGIDWTFNPEPLRPWPTSWARRRAAPIRLCRCPDARTDRALRARVCCGTISPGRRRRSALNQLFADYYNAVR